MIRRVTVAGVAGTILALLLSSVTLATSRAIDTEFSVDPDCRAVVLTATGHDDNGESGFGVVFGVSENVANMPPVHIGPYDIADGEVLTFGPLDLGTGDYLLMWDNERPITSHRELAFSVVCETGIVPPIESTAPTPPSGGGNDRPDRGPEITPPPTDTAPGSAPVPNALGSVGLVLAVLVGVAVAFAVGVRAHLR